MTNIDAHAATRSLIDNSFSYLTWHEDICRELRFKGISQVWVQDPAWYFWLEGVDGAFWLRFLDAESCEDAINLNLAVHFFPATTHPLFSGLSQREKDLIGDPDSFDTPTLTPRFEHFDRFIPHFVVAELGAVIAADSQLSLLYLSTEQGDDHPLSAMTDLLIGALNFYRKKPQNACYEIRQSHLTHLFLEFEASAMAKFLAAFGIDQNPVMSIHDTERTSQWKKAAEFHAKCTVTSSCGCHH